MALSVTDMCVCVCRALPVPCTVIMCGLLKVSLMDLCTLSFCRVIVSSRIARVDILMESTLCLGGEGATTSCL